MKKILYSLTLLFLLNFNSNAQRGQAVFAELLGNGIIFSFNYDTRFNAKPDGIGARIGLGYIGSTDEGGLVTIPIQANWLLGKNGRYFELGLGATILSGSGEIFDEDLSEVVGTMTFGYRRQPVDGGFMWKIAITPILADGFFLPYFVGIGLGYTF